MKGDVEYVALSHALDETRPPCRDDWRFVCDEHDLDGMDLMQMREMCRMCPVRGLCDAYAAAARPTGGMWAGRYYTPSKRRAAS